jgi:hypothetical protein
MPSLQALDAPPVNVGQMHALASAAAAASLMSASHYGALHRAALVLDLPILLIFDQIFTLTSAGV